MPGRDPEGAAGKMMDWVLLVAAMVVGALLWAKVRGFLGGG